jgi:hypothetical protein
VLHYKPVSLCPHSCVVFLLAALLKLLDVFRKIKVFISPTDAPFLGAFAELRKANVSVVMSVCRSVCSHGTTRLPLDRFL